MRLGAPPANVVLGRVVALNARSTWPLRQCARMEILGTLDMGERDEGVRVSAYFDWWDGRQHRALLVEGERVIIGSAPDCDLLVGDTSVSRIHAMLHQLNGRWFIEDCGSRNGTEVNGHQLTSLQPLQPNDEVRLGRARLVFCGQVSMSENPTDTLIKRPPITSREHDVLVALCRPRANCDIFTEPATVRQMAVELTVSENAVKLRLASVTVKFGIDGPERRRSRLANAALDAGAVALADLRGG